MKKQTALTIAASDSSGGAGIQADLKSFSYAQVHGATIITCITAQNTKNVQRIYPLPPRVIQSQLESVITDLNIDTAKTGLLYNTQIISLISKNIRKHSLKVIVDPVMTSTTGHQLCAPDFISSLINDLIPHAYLVTPNINEAEKLSKKRITNHKDIKEACLKIFELGPKNVLIKGGHLSNKYTKDILFDGKKFYQYSLPHLNRKAHGSGCTLSALVTAFIAKGMTIHSATKHAKQVLWGMIYYGYNPGKGVDIVNHMAHHHPPSLQDNDIHLWIELQDTINNLLPNLSPRMIPEVGINFVYALPQATDKEKVLGIQGRIIRIKDKAHQVGNLQLGASTHVAAIVLASMNHEPDMRSAMNIAFSTKILKRAKKMGFLIGTFNRKDEPPDQKTMDWGTKTVIEILGEIPDIIWDSGSQGKEPMIRIIAKSPKQVLEKVIALREK